MSKRKTLKQLAAQDKYRVPDNSDKTILKYIWSTGKFISKARRWPTKDRNVSKLIKLEEEYLEYLVAEFIKERGPKKSKRASK